MIHAIDDLAIRNTVGPNAFVDALYLLIIRLDFVNSVFTKLCPAR